MNDSISIAATKIVNVLDDPSVQRHYSHEAKLAHVAQIISHNVTSLTPLAPPTLPTATLLTDELNALVADSHRFQQLASFLQFGGASISTEVDNDGPREGDGIEEDDRWNHAYVIGYEFEREHRGCYGFKVLGQHRTWRRAVDIAMDAWEKECARFRAQEDRT